MKNTTTFNDRAMNGNDEIWATEADHRKGWNTPFMSGTYRAMLFGIVLRDYPKQIVSLAKVKSVPTNMRKFLSWAQRHYRIDVTASTMERKTGGPASAGACAGGCKECSHRGSNAHLFHQVDVQPLWYRSEARTSSATTGPSYMFSSTHGRDFIMRFAGWLIMNRWLAVPEAPA